MPIQQPSRLRRLATPLASLVAVLLVGGTAFLSLAARAQPTAPSDWPCVQVLVPEISPSVLWPVPIDPAISDSWRSDPRTRALAERLGDLERLDPLDVEAMDTYAASVPESDRREALTRLADGIVGTANARRETYIDGIRRYTRQQIAIAGQIESTLNALAELDDAELGSTSGQGTDTAAGVSTGTGDGTGDGAAPPGGATRADIEETLVWHERLYDQRERAIRALCERPVELEERLSEVLRELAYRLPDA